MATKPEISLDAILDKIGNPNWDALIIGDGSGTSWNTSCGWASTIIDKLTRGRRIFFGAAEPGSCYFAEMQPYIQALNWYDAFHGRKRLQRKTILRVHILTDSQIFARAATRACRSPSDPLPKMNRMLYASFQYLERQGYEFHFHWGSRMTTGGNWAADLIAGLCRRELLKCRPSDNSTPLAVQAANVLDGLQFIDPSTKEPLSPHSYDK